MKILKGLGIFILAIVLIYVVLAFFGPKNYTVERTKEINAPAEVVFEQVSKFNNWQNWSPWKEKDPTATYTLTGEDGVVGTEYKWSGNPDLSGKGSMIINEVVPNQKFGYDLTFFEPWEMSSKGGFELTPNGETTTVKWYDKGDIPFAQRPFMLFMSLDDMIGGDFERGLTKIDSISVLKAQAEEKNKNLSETDFPGGKYIGIKHNIKISELDSTTYANAYARLGEYMAKNNIETIGAPCSITTKWDEEADSCEIMIAFPVADMIEPTEKDITYVDIPTNSSILYKFYGDYNQMGTAYDEIHAYMKDKNLKGGKYAIEEYVTDPSTVDNKDEVLTNIYYLVE